MKYFYDFEFEENGITIIPISIGIVSEDDRQLYLINEDYFYVPNIFSSPTQWLVDNVLKYIDAEQIEKHGLAYDQWGDKVIDFISDGGRYTSRDEIELYAWYEAYDHVALAQIWGPMINLPEPIPMFTREIEDFRQSLSKKQKVLERDYDKYPEHHALYDALYQRDLYNEWTRPKLIGQAKDEESVYLRAVESEASKFMQSTINSVEEIDECCTRRNR